MIAGFVGLVSLVSENWNNSSTKLHTVTLVFGIPVGLCGALIAYGCCSEHGSAEDVSVGLAVLIPGFLLLSVVYSDWALGTMTNNLVGTPVDNKVLFWCYWVSKRFTMLSL